jgi:P27 family predicted phage terminase small subunit
MGKRGPKPRVRGVSVPSCLEGEPEPPGDLDPVARDAWDRLTGLLRSMGMLCLADRDALTLYAVTFSRWRRAEADIDRLGTALIDKYGVAKANPAGAMAKDCRATLIRLMGEFGLTPSARAGLNLPGKPGRLDGKWDGLLDFDGMS